MGVNTGLRGVLVSFASHGRPLFGGQAPSNNSRSPSHDKSLKIEQTTLPVRSLTHTHLGMETRVANYIVKMRAMLCLGFLSSVTPAQRASGVDWPTAGPRGTNGPERINAPIPSYCKSLLNICLSITDSFDLHLLILRSQMCGSHRET